MAPDLPDLVLVLAAGLRADAPGEPGAEAAFLDPFAPGLVSMAAYAQSTEPFVSLGSLLTGRYPSAVPLCGSVRASEASGLEELWCHALPDGADSLPSVLALYGYRTALFHHLAPGLEAPFGHAVGLEPREGAARWEELAPAVTAWWAEAEGAPRLLVLELPDLDLAQRTDLLPDLGLPAPEPPETSRAELTVLPPRRPACTPLQGVEGLEDGAWDGLEGEVPDPAGTRARALALYEAEAARLGAQVHGLLRALPGSRPRVVALAGLHGLSIGEGGGTDLDARAFFWSDRLVDRTVHVPLAIADGGPMRVLDQPVELLDLMPTLLARAGAVPPHGLPGQDLLAPGLTEDPEAVAYAERGDMLALRRQELLLVMRAVVHHMSSLDPYLTEILLCPGFVGGFRLHDVHADPWQALDLRRARPVDAEALETAMIERRTGPAAPAPILGEGDRLLRLRLTPSEGYW